MLAWKDCATACNAKRSTPVSAARARWVTLGSGARRSKRGDGCAAGGGHLRQRARQHAAQPGRDLRSWGALPCSTLTSLLSWEPCQAAILNCATSQVVQPEQALSKQCERTKKISLVPVIH